MEGTHFWAKKYITPVRDPNLYYLASLDGLQNTMLLCTSTTQLQYINYINSLLQRNYINYIWLCYLNKIKGGMQRQELCNFAN